MSRDVLDLAFIGVALALLVSGGAVTFRHRSPYTGTPIDPETKRRLRTGGLLFLTGNAVWLGSHIWRWLR